LYTIILNFLLPFPFLIMKTILSVCMAVLCVATVLVSSCTRQFPTTPGAVSNDYAPLIQVTNTWPFGTTQAAGVRIPFELVFISSSPIREINVYQVVNRTASGVTTRDTSRVFTGPYAPAFSREKQADTLVLTHTTPSVTRPVGTTVAVNVVAEIITQNGIIKRRAFSAANGYVLAAP
jgi:hypothetical protein